MPPLLYILDANVLIDANRDYYPINRIPEFWEWLVEAGNNNQVKIPVEVYEEFKDNSKKVDDLTVWARDQYVMDALLWDEQCNVELVGRIVNEGYAADLSDDEVENIGRDPFLIAYALVEPLGRCIVTTEGSKPSRKRGNRQLPDVCDQFNIKHCNTYKFIREMDFKTRRR